MFLRTDLTLTASMNAPNAEHMKRRNRFQSSRVLHLCTTVTYKRLTFLLSIKWKTPYCRVMS